MYPAFDLALEDGSTPATSFVGFTENPGTEESEIEIGDDHQASLPDCT